MQIRSKDNVKNHGEVFTPPNIVKDMLELFPEHVWVDPEYVFLEPTCGNGNFLVQILQKRIDSGIVPLYALNRIIGMDISLENILEARKRLSDIVIYNGEYDFNLVQEILENNIIQVTDSLMEIKLYGLGGSILDNMELIL